jgi:hypothetical protein
MSNMKDSIEFNGTAVCLDLDHPLNRGLVFNSITVSRLFSPEEIRQLYEESKAESQTASSVADEPILASD